jgi:Peptidase family M1 domain
MKFLSRTFAHTLARTVASGHLVAAALCTVALSGIAGAQDQKMGESTPPRSGEFDATGVNDTSVFAPLPMPQGSEFRSASGAPGPRYWQNHADYDIQASIDTAAQTLTGQLRLRYTNHSPDTLHFVWFQVEQNAFKDSSLNALVFPQQSRFGSRGFDGGDVIDRFDLVRGPTAHVALVTRVEGTELKADLPQGLAPGATATFDIAWHFKVPEHGADRMGRDGALYELAQWYPRVAVYDDLRGWNIEPYLGQGEFYLEYGDFTYAVTVPAGYIVAGTGSLDNGAEVLTAAERARLAKAATSATPVAITTPEELSSGAARPKSTGTLTWRFHAHNVRDVAWGAAPNYQWDASSWHGILAQAYYRPSAAPVWKDAADMARMSIEEYSTRWYPYPYPQITALEGPISGMEYPMLAMEDRNDDEYQLYSVVTHEIGHNWFPMIVGSNERIHFWQDEGLNTFINLFSEARRYPAKGDQMGRAGEERALEEKAESIGVDIPIELQADRVPPQLLGLNSYDKPSVGLQLLREEILGHDAFDDAFRTYIRRWAYKHPAPADFFRTMEDVGGHRLDWFWREFWLNNYHFDQAIDTVVVQHRGDTDNVVVRYANRARGVLPIRARFTFSDGSTEDFHYPAEVWSTNTTRYLRRYSFPGKHVTRIELDPDHRLIDIDRSNNVWSAPPTS